MTMHAKIFLSKSRYIRGLQFHKSLYLYTYHPEVKRPVILTYIHSFNRKGMAITSVRFYQEESLTQYIPL